VKKFGAKAKKFAKEADLLVEELKELAKKPKTSYQEANEFVEKAVQFAKKAAKPPDKTLKQYRETARKAVYAWCVQAKTVVAVAKFEDENEKILYEASYKNCAPQKKHAEDFFQEDIENRVLGEKVEENPNGGTITLYLPYQPCNKSTQTGNTVPNQSCCDVLKTIVKRLRKNRRNINLCVKAANTRRLSLTKEKGNNEKLRKNAVDGIKMLMQVKGVNVSGMTPEDWGYLLSLTEDFESRQDLDKSVQNILDEIQDESDQDESDQDESGQDEMGHVKKSFDSMQLSK
jgi:hypothetical protein